MQTLGLSDSTPRTESRWRALFWPAIRNATDLDYVTRQGFWICSLVALVTFILNVASGAPLSGAFDAAFFFFAALGIRERSRVAAITAFVAYLLAGFVLVQRYSVASFGIVRVIFTVLLFANVRGNWLAARWSADAERSAAPARLKQTITDRLADQLPAFLWPKLRFVFYALAVLEMAGLLLLLFAPKPPVSGDVELTRLSSR